MHSFCRLLLSSSISFLVRLRFRVASVLAWCTTTLVLAFLAALCTTTMKIVRSTRSVIHQYGAIRNGCNSEWPNHAPTCLRSICWSKLCEAGAQSTSSAHLLKLGAQLLLGGDQSATHLFVVVRFNWATMSAQKNECWTPM